MFNIKKYFASKAPKKDFSIEMQNSMILLSNGSNSIYLYNFSYKIGYSSAKMKQYQQYLRHEYVHFMIGV
jgi:alanine-alpha-ketoisovalerate/valine-pyruvate aminotransferase